MIHRNNIKPTSFDELKNTDVFTIYEGDGQEIPELVDPKLNRGEEQERIPLRSMSLTQSMPPPSQPASSPQSIPPRSQSPSSSQSVSRPSQAAPLTQSMPPSSQQAPLTQSMPPPSHSSLSSPSILPPFLSAPLTQSIPPPSQPVPQQPPHTTKYNDITDEELLELLDMDEAVSTQSKDILKLIPDSVISEVESLFKPTQPSQSEQEQTEESRIDCSLREDAFRLSQPVEKEMRTQTMQIPKDDHNVKPNSRDVLSFDDMDDLIGDDLKDYL